MKSYAYLLENAKFLPNNNFCNPILNDDVLFSAIKFIIHFDFDIAFKSLQWFTHAWVFIHFSKILLSKKTIFQFGQNRMKLVLIFRFFKSSFYVINWQVCSINDV